ncbi:hypothetical protein [Edaphobacter dinghuensis]|uniref:Uncharacterized protein n=1 Tax=Edaphobacter dinghuensis TaxID=1560005 RepID=A0A917HD06_9BACT|nr:hypothetical protein [Edaphobacter dinghuensis]GGG75429.1 hypothetical protein GCM10011585_17810 [Edaphobacter dinghuensis]
MSSTNQIAERTAEIARILATENDLKAFQQHMEEVLRGEAFRGSHRSAQFLRFVVDQAVGGHGEELKERLIGIELFDRSPNYDTGEDAIVRVTASDVRRRLLQHYGACGTRSEFRIGLPLGSYVPEIARDVSIKADAADEKEIEQATEGQPDAPVAASTLPQEEAAASVEEDASLSKPSSPSTIRSFWTWRRLLLCGAGMIAVVCMFTFWQMSREVRVNSGSVWGALFGYRLSTKLITSDPNIAEVQTMTGRTITLSDYANQRYIPDKEKVSPQQMTLFTAILQRDQAASVDPGIAVNIAQWMDQAKAGHLTIQSARDLRFPDLLRDGNFILLGSPLSNPWALFYNDHVDFRFVFDQSTGQEIVENRHPRSGESAKYVPTALGFATGQSFAVASYLRNPDHLGHVLLIAGADAEGTEAVADLVTDSAGLMAVMNGCGLLHRSPVPSFQLLLRLSTMAGSPAHTDVIACHQLP